MARRGRASVLYLACIFCCVAVRAGAPQTANIKLSVQPRDVIAQRLQRLHPENAQREIELKTIFEEAGCPREQIQEQVVRRKDPPNVICTLPGATESLIIVGGARRPRRRGNRRNRRLERSFATTESL
jgi:hypothetical protein